VGDSDQLEMCPTGFGGVCEGGDCTEEHFSDFRIGVLSDDFDDIYQDAGVGRLSVDSEMDLGLQLVKVMRYESTPPNATDFWGEVLLAAHHDPGAHYIESAESAADWPDYEYGVLFTERYGDQADGTVAQVVADINDGMSVVAYRGIGSNTTWDAWDYANESLTGADVAALVNGAKNPVVFAIASGNSGIDNVDDAMGETWLNGAQGGAVFHYGSTRTSGMAHNNELLPAIFRLLYGGANPTLWELTTWAQYEAKDLAGSTESTSEQTIRQYQILGLPDMKVYTETPYELVVNGLPAWLAGLGPHTVTLDIDLSRGEPASNAKVSFYEIERKLLYKSEFADGDGQLTTDLLYDDYGSKGVLVTDDFGSALPWEGVIEVVEFGTDAPQTQVFSASAAPNPFNPNTTIHFRLPQAGHLSVRIYDARGRLVRALVDDDLVAGPGETSWDGTDTAGRDLAAGVYFFEVRTEIDRMVGKLALVK
ncbi:MAG: hypothetical protein KAI97_08170, partial [Gemmatimonadetes bacterium]|nr:hypothetical protein [Gemmatimonadota bacterium]